MRIFLDLDGVLSDLMGAMGRAHGLPIPNPWPPGQYNLMEAFGFKGTNSEFWRHVDGPEFWAKMPWLPDGQLILKIIESVGLPVTILTSPTIDPYCLAGKYMWIKKNIPSYHRKFLIGPEKHPCAHPGSILVDDSDDKVDAFNKEGGHGILLPRPWNRNHLEKPIPYLMRRLEDVIGKPILGHDAIRRAFSARGTRLGEGECEASDQATETSVGQVSFGV